MIQKWSFYTSLILIVLFLSYGFKPFEHKNYNWSEANRNDELSYLFPSKEQKDYTNLNVPFTGKFFIGFKEALAFKESQGKYNKVNSLGYMGKYQFGSETLKTIGIQDNNAFLRNPKLQEEAFVLLLSRNKWKLKDEIQQFSGKVISGVKVTESGILAAAHLGGVGSVKKFLNSNGSKKCTDDYGTSITSYMSDFGGFETKGIVAIKDAKIE